jgi:hypothetical protein
MATTNDSSATWFTVELSVAPWGSSYATWGQIEVLAAESGVGYSTWAQVEVLNPVPEAIIATPAETALGDPAVFNGAASLATKFRWKWTTLPSGTANENTQTLYPDSGAATPIDMTNNEALYHLNDLTTDSSGNANGLTASGGVSVGTGKITGGGSAVFAAGTDTIQMATALPTNGVDWSIGFWFKGLKSNATYRTGARGTTSIHHLIIDTGSNNVGLYDGAFIDAGFRMAEADYTGWNHILLSAASGVISYYVNGSGAGAITRTITDPIKSINNYQIGGQLFADEVSEIATWSRAVTAQEIWDIYALQEGSYVGQTGKTNTLNFIADKPGVYIGELEVAYGGDPVVTSTATLDVAAPAGMLPFQGTPLLSGPSLSGGGADRFAGGFLKIFPLLGKK